jgi:hypothetical protein
LINDGLVSANVAGKTLLVGTGTLTNMGTLQALNGGILNIDLTASGMWENAGTLSVDSLSAITISSVITSSQDVSFLHGSVFDAVLGSNGESGIITIAGGIGFESNVDLNLSLVPGADFSTPYEIISYTGTLTGTFAEVTPGFVVDYSQPGEILVTAVPEPGAFAFLAGSAGLALGRRRRRAVQAG